MAGTDDAVERAAAHVRAHAGEPLTLGELAASVGMSPSRLQRAFSERYGMSPKQYHTALRVEALKAALRDGRDVASAGYEAGFGSSRGAWEAATARVGMSPGAYARGGAGVTIAHTVVASTLGRVLVARTAAGVCAVMLGESDEALREALVHEFPAATHVRDDAALADDAAAVVAYAESPGSPRPGLPLDLHGTAFQRRVWDELLTIPAGTTVTYAGLAEAIGRPTAQRAVAGACGANHVALLVPCHRVVRSDGGHGGYRWGVGRKRELLAREGAGRGPAPARGGVTPPR